MHWFRRLDPDSRAVVVGAAAAPALLVAGVLIGLGEGGLLPNDCQGLACLYFGLLLGYSGVLLVLWALLWGVAALSRRRWPRSLVRTRILRVLAALSYAPLLWLAATGILDLT